MDEPRFTLAEVGSMLEVRPETLWQQMRRGVIPLRAKRGGMGNEIALSGYDVINVVTVHELGKLGAGAKKLTDIAASLIHQRAYMVLSSHPRPDIAVLFRNSDGDWDMKIGRAASQNQPYATAVLRIDDLVRDVFKRLNSIVKNR
jgi:hypothetical protein